MKNIWGCILNIIDKTFILYDHSIENIYEKVSKGLLDNKYGSGDFNRIITEEPNKYLKLFSYDVYYTVELPSGKMNTNEKNIMIWFNKENDYIKVRIKIIPINRRNKKIISDLDIILLSIYTRIYTDLSGKNIDDESREVLLTYKNILKKETDTFYLFFIAIIIIIPILLRYPSSIIPFFIGILFYVLYSYLHS